MTFSHGAIDYILLFPQSTHALWLLIIGPLWALLDYTAVAYTHLDVDKRQRVASRAWGWKSGAATR